MEKPKQGGVMVLGKYRITLQEDLSVEIVDMESEHRYQNVGAWAIEHGPGAPPVFRMQLVEPGRAPERPRVMAPVPLPNLRGERGH